MTINERDDQLLTPEQAGAYLGVRVDTLAVWRSTNRYSIPFIKVGTSVRYRRSELDKWIAERTVNPGSPSK